MQPLDFLKAYEEFHREVLVPTQIEIKALTKPWRSPEFWISRYAGDDPVAPSPVHRVYSRIKRPESVVDKIRRQPQQFRGGLTKANLRRMNDTIGVRVVTHFLGDFLTIDQLIRDCDGFVVSEDEPPRAYLNADLQKRLGLNDMAHYDKESGYASIHYVLKLADSSVPEAARPWFELQLRTMAEDTWGQVEHQLGYKPGKGTTMAVRQQFRIIANHLGAVDEHFDFLRSELEFLQGASRPEDKELLSTENLPQVLQDLHLRCAQQEIDGLLKLLFSRGIEKVGEFRSTANPSRLQLIQNEHQAKLGRPPTVFDVVSNLANLKDCTDRDQEIRQIDAQIQYLITWNALRRQADAASREDRQ